MTGSARVRVVVVHYGDADLTRRCLASLERLDWPAGQRQVVLVDNGDGPPPASTGAGLRVLAPGGNVGFAAAVNLAAADPGAEPCDYVALLNNDAVADPGWLGPLVAALDADPGLGAVVSKILLEAPPGVINSTGLCLFAGGFGGDRGYLEPDDGRYDEPAEVFGWCGGAVLLRPDYLRDVGPLDEAFFAYYEDFDHSWRGRRRGWRFAYAPGSVVHHRHAAALGVGSDRFDFLVGRNRLLTLVKLAPAQWALRALAVEAKLALVGGRAAARRHGRILAATGLALPRALRQRGVLRRTRFVADSELLRWVTPR